MALLSSNYISISIDNHDAIVQIMYSTDNVLI